MANPATEPLIKIRIDDIKERRGVLTGLVVAFHGAESKFGRYVRDLEREANIRQTADDIAHALRDAFKDAGKDPWTGDMIYERLQLQIEEAAAALEERPGYTMPPPHRYAESVRYMLDQMSESGRWLFEKDSQACYYFNGVTSTPVNVRSDDIKNVIALKFGRAEDEPGIKHLLTRMTTYPLLPGVGEPVKLRHNSWYDASENVLYLDQREGNILRVTADAPPEVIKNGTDGVLFDPDPIGEPWEYLPKHETVMRDGWIDRMSFSELADCPFTLGEQQALFYFYTLSFWFRSSMRARPLAMAYGESDSGKSTAFEQIGQLLIGPKFTTNTAPDKDKRTDFETSVVNQRFMVIDNLDYRVAWLEDLLAAISTGSAIKARVLFENMKLGYYYPDIFITITTREPHHRRDDIANRSIFWLFQPVSKDRKADPNEMFNWLVAKRNDMLSEMVDFAREVLRTDVPRHYRTSFRMVGLASFMARAAAAMDRLAGDGAWWEADDGYDSHTAMAEGILEKQQAYQRQYTAEADPLMTVLPLWMNARQRLQHAAPDWLKPLVDEQGRAPSWAVHWMNGGISTTELYRQLSDLATVNRINWPLKSVQGLGMRIASHRTSLEREYQLIGPRRLGASPGRSGGTYWQIRPIDSPQPPDMFE